MVDNTLRGISLVMAMALIRVKSLGVLAGNALHAFVGQRIGGKRFEDLSIPLAVVATDLTSGTAAARAALPGIRELLLRRH